MLEKTRQKQIYNMPITEKVFKIFLVSILGVVMGFLARYVEGIPVIGELGQCFGIWIFSGTIIAAWSRAPIIGALNIFIFLISSSISYSYYSVVLKGIFPIEYLFAWYLFSLFSSGCAYFIWYSRGEGGISAFITSFPLSILLIEGYAFFHTFALSRALDLIFAIILLFILNKNFKQKVIVICFTLIASFTLLRIEFLTFILG